LANGDDGALAGSAWATPAALLVAVLIGCLVGSINGVSVAVLRMPPFMVTLTSMMLISGLAVWWTQSKTIHNLPHSFLIFGQNAWLASAITICVAGFAQWTLGRSLYGLQLRSVGHNPQAAAVSGVPVVRVVMRAYIACGVCAAVAAILITGQLETGSPVQWETNLLDIIGATVIGGTSLFGGRGNIICTGSGVLLLTLIDNSLNLLNLSYFTIMMAKGGFIMLAALLDSWRHRLTEGNQT
jgi:ribose/xylose/arabinose/galactoside ABC-type transport system permease subunit